MTRANWVRLVEGFDLGTFPLRLAYAVIGPDFAPRLQVSLTAISVRTGLPTVIVQTTDLLPNVPGDDAGLAVLFNAGLALIEHELAEHARFAGRRIFDPHVAEVA